jgi:hypothetical protein
MPDYLEKSTETLNRSIGQRVEKDERAIARRFALALNEIRAQLSLVYQQYEVDGILNLLEMARFDRLNQLFQQIDFILGRNYQDLQQTIYDTLGFSYAESYNLTAYSIEAAAATSVGYTLASSEQIAAAIAIPIDKLTLPQRLERNRKEVTANIRNEIVQGLSQGSSYRTMTDRIKPVLGGDAVKAQRVIRTETHRVMETAKRESAEYADSQGVRMLKEWNSSQDERVRHRPKDQADHRKLNGKKIPVKEDFQGTKGRGPGPGQMGHPAEDINCRCFLTYEIEDITAPDDTEYVRTTFDKWQEEKRRNPPQVS